MKVSEKLFQENHTAIPETTTCSVCKKECGSYAGLSKHINRLHAELSEDVDSVEGYTRQLNKLLLIKRIMDVAIKYGDGATLSLIMKFMIPYFKASGHNKYALACFEHVAQTKFFLSPRMKELVIHECFVNNKGNANSNMAMDLAIEHCNKFFKDNFTLKDSTPSQAVLNRLSFSQDTLEKVLASFNSGFGLGDNVQSRSVDQGRYMSDLEKVVKYLAENEVFCHISGRRHQSAKLRKASVNMVELLDMAEFKAWMVDKYETMEDQCFLPQ